MQRPRAATAAATFDLALSRLFSVIVVFIIITVVTVADVAAAAAVVVVTTTTTGVGCQRGG